MRIFLDVGSHHGQTIKRVLNPAYKVDIVYGFEPSPSCRKHLKKRFAGDKRVIILKFGLWKKTVNRILYNEGTQGATILSDYKSDWHGFGKETLCSFTRASEWFQDNLNCNDEIFLKMNCEGSECDIVNDLIGSGEFKKLKAVLIDYDVRKSPSRKFQQEELKKRLVDLNITNVYDYMGKARLEVLDQLLRIKAKKKKGI